MATAAEVLPAARRRMALAAGRATVREVYFVKRIDNSRLLREVDLAQRRQCYTLVALAGLAFALLFAYEWQHFQCVRYDYEIEQLRGQERALAEWNQQLELDQAGLEDPKRIDELAREKLGLAAPDPRRIVPVDQLPDRQSRRDEPQLAETFATGGLAREP